jgi:hypothetical protein
MNSDGLFKIDVEHFRNKMSGSNEYINDNLRAYKALVLDKKMYFFVLEEDSGNPPSTPKTKKSEKDKSAEEKLQKFAGYVNEEFKREGLGKYLYNNRSTYTGNWVNNLKQGKGIYYSPYQDIAYVGEFNQGKMKNGILLKYSPEGPREVFVGKFSGNNEYNQGFLFRFVNNDEDYDFSGYYVYFGKYDGEKRNDTDCLIRLHKKQFYFMGEIKDDVAIQGYQFDVLKNTNYSYETTVDPYENTKIKKIGSDEKDPDFQSRLKKAQAFDLFCSQPWVHDFRPLFDKCKDIHNQKFTRDNVVKMEIKMKETFDYYDSFIVSRKKDFETVYGGLKKKKTAGK